nr:MAG TPA: protein of unknown function (DUF4330) [Inoviridae sp.]
MKYLNNNLTTIIIVLLTLKLIDFKNISILDILIVVLLIINIILSFITRKD